MNFRSRSPGCSAAPEARFSDVLLKPVKALTPLSDSADNEFSEIARAPVKTLPRTSEGTTLSSGNFPAPLLTESAIETTTDRDIATPLFTTSDDRKDVVYAESVDLGGRLLITKTKRIAT